MTIWTAAELAEQIAAYKQGLLALATAQSTVIETGISRTTFTRAEIPQLRDQLMWLEAEQNRLNGSSGPVFTTGRPKR